MLVIGTSATSPGPARRSAAGGSFYGFCAGFFGGCAPTITIVLPTCCEVTSTAPDGSGNGSFVDAAGVAALLAVGVGFEVCAKKFSMPSAA